MQEPVDDLVSSSDMYICPHDSCIWWRDLGRLLLLTKEGSMLSTLPDCCFYLNNELCKLPLGRDLIYLLRNFKTMLCDSLWYLLLFFPLCFSQKSCFFYICSVKHFYMPVCALIENPLSPREWFLFSKARVFKNNIVPLRLPANWVRKICLVLFASYVVPSVKADFFLKAPVRIPASLSLLERGSQGRLGGSVG